MRKGLVVLGAVGALGCFVAGVGIGIIVGKGGRR